MFIFDINLCYSMILRRASEKDPKFKIRRRKNKNYDNSCNSKFAHAKDVKVIPQFCIAHFYCAHLSFYDNFMLLQNIFGYIRAKNYR